MSIDQIPKPEPPMCTNCMWYTKLPPRKRADYCIKRKFAIFDSTKTCTKYIRKVKHEEP